MRSNLRRPQTRNFREEGRRHKSLCYGGYVRFAKVPRRRLTRCLQFINSIVKDIQNTVTKSAHNSAAIRAFNTKMDTQKISRWRQDLNRILLVFNVGVDLCCALAEIMLISLQTELQIVNTITTDEINEQLHDVSESVKEGNRLASEVDESIREARLDIKEVHREVTEFKVI